MKIWGKLLVAASICASVPAIASPNLVKNGSFEDVSVTQKSGFKNHVADWSGGEGLNFIDFPGSADDPSYTLPVYGPFPKTSPDGGNFVQEDGDPTYAHAITQLITGLTIGQSYTLSFFQAAGQQLNFRGPTTERWDVSFGDQSQLSPKFSLPQGGVGPWEKVSMNFTADSTSQLLSFLAKGTPNGEPPISFLDGVSMTAAPEPAAWCMMIVGFGMIGTAMRRRRRLAVA